MLAFSAQSANDAWLQLADAMAGNGKLQEGRDQMTRELLHVMVEIQNPRQRVVFARPMNPAFAIAETILFFATGTFFWTSTGLTVWQGQGAKAIPIGLK